MAHWSQSEGDMRPEPNGATPFHSQIGVHILETDPCTAHNKHITCRTTPYYRVPDSNHMSKLTSKLYTSKTPPQYRQTYPHSGHKGQSCQ